MARDFELLCDLFINSGATDTDSLPVFPSVKPDGGRAPSQPWIVKGEQSGLQMRIAMTESVSLCVPMKN